MMKSELEGCYLINGHHICRPEIAGDLALDGFVFTAAEHHWSESEAQSIFRRIGDIEPRLTDRDCRAYVLALEKYMNDSTQLVKHLSTITYRLLKKWRVV